jgi:hypothetical protein
MRILARFGLGLCGVVLGVASAARADDSPTAPDARTALSSQAQGHHHQGLFGWRHCVECQRAWAKKHDGVDVPPPPSNLPASVVPGQVVHDHNPGAACAACQAGAVVMGPVTVVDSYPPGHAVVGGPVMAGNYPPGYAVMGGAGGPAMAGGDPAPVGVSQSGQPRWNAPRMAAAAPRPGSSPYDPAVMPSSMIPAQTALAGPTGDRPHVISHLFGFGGIRRHAREEREDKKREAHAAISYDPPAQPVTALPAAMVYGKGH